MREWFEVSARSLIVLTLCGCGEPPVSEGGDGDLDAGSDGGDAGADERDSRDADADLRRDADPDDFDDRVAEINCDILPRMEASTGL